MLSIVMLCSGSSPKIDGYPRWQSKLWIGLTSARCDASFPRSRYAEIDRIIRKKNLPLTIDEVLATIATGDGFAAIAFDLEIFQIMLTMPENFEMHDRIIAATARYSEAKLITRDEVLRNSGEVETVWD